MECSKENKKLVKAYCRHNLNKYLRATTLHGLKYLADDSITIWEKSFFVCAFLAALMATTNLIANVYAKWVSTPVIIGISPFPTSILSIPFPAITLCNMNQVLASRVSNYTKESNEGALLKLLCNADDIFDEQLMEKPNFKNNNLSFSNFLQMHAQPCSKMLLSCSMGSVNENCSDLFHEIMTDEGLCCVFNVLHPYFLFTGNAKKIIKDYKRSDNSTAVDWNPETGYTQDLPTDYFPHTTAGTGVSLGLTLILDADLAEYFCSSTNGPGFKIDMHNAIEATAIRETAIVAAVGYETRLRIEVVSSEATDALRSLPRHLRQCLFNGEEKLLYFAHYSHRNCECECQVKFLYEQCNCIPHTLPLIFINASVCDTSQAYCVYKAENMWMKGDGGTDCRNRCLPACFDLTYRADTTSTPLRSHDYLTPPSLLRNISMQYANKNVAVLHFYYRESIFHGDLKNVYVGFTEFLSNTGGILGLFMGFSFISVAEIIYFAFMRPVFEFLLPLRRQKKIESKTASMQEIRAHLQSNKRISKVNRE